MAFDIDECISRLLQKQVLGEAVIKEVCEKVKELLMRESNVVHLSAPVTVVGDIHGSAYCKVIGGRLMEADLRDDNMGQTDNFTT
jgi:hypothetical protein